MSRPKRLIHEIHERPLSQVPAFVSATRTTGCGSSAAVPEQARTGRGRMVTFYIARDPKGAGQLAADVLRPVTEKPRARE